MKNNEYTSHESAVIDEGCSIGAGTKIWHFSHLMSGCKLGENCVIGQNVFISSKVILGNNVKIQNNVSLYDGVICGDDVFIGPSAVFTNVINPRSAVNRKSEFKSTIIERGATVGANATIRCGIRLGSFSFVGAGAVVLHDVASYAVVVGNPEKRIGWMSEEGERIQFDEQNTWISPTSGGVYQLIDDAVIKATRL